MSKDRQLCLFDDIDKPLKHYRSGVWYIGDFFEEAVAAIFGAHRYRTLAGHTCPDLLGKDGSEFLECKGMRHGGSTAIFISMIDRFKIMMDRNDLGMTYLFCIHRVKPSKVATQQTLLRKLGQTFHELYLVPAALVFAQQAKLKHYNDPRIRLGPFYRLNYSWLTSLPVEKHDSVHTDDMFNVYGYPLYNVDVIYIKEEESE